MKKKALLAAVAGSYLVALHAVTVTALVKTDLVDRVLIKAHLKERIVPLTNHQYYMATLGNHYATRLQTAGDRPQLVFIGDSITEDLCTESQFDAINLGISGDSVRGLSERIDRYGNLANKVVILAIGVNDLHRPPAEIIRDYDYVLRKLEPVARIIISSVLPVDEDAYENYWRGKNSQIADLNRRLQELADAHRNVYFADTSRYLRDGSSGLRQDFHVGDGIHLNKEGYLSWIRGLREAIQKVAVQDPAVGLAAAASAAGL